MYLIIFIFVGGISVLVVTEEAEEPREEPVREGGRDDPVEAVEPPAGRPVAPAQAEDAGGDEEGGQRRLQPGERDQISGHGGVHLARVNLLDHNTAPPQLSSEALGEGSYEVFGGGVL